MNLGFSHWKALTTRDRRSAGRVALLLAIAFYFTQALAAAAAAEDLIGLYLTWARDPTSTMTINWVDIYADSSDTVWYREYKEGDGARSKLSNPTWAHRPCSSAGSS